MSTIRCKENGISGGGEGASRRRFFGIPESGSLGRWKISCGLSHFVERYHSCVCGFIAFCRECWSFSGIRGFLL